MFTIILENVTNLVDFSRLLFFLNTPFLKDASLLCLSLGEFAFPFETKFSSLTLREFGLGLFLLLDEIGKL